MKVNQLPGWPPREFQCTEDPSLPFQPSAQGLRIDSVTYVPGSPKGKSLGDMVLTLIDFERAEHCTTRFEIQDADMARRLQVVLTQCRGLTLDQAGLREIPENVK